MITPGEKTTVTYPFVMHEGMGGPHLFEITLKTDSQEAPSVVLRLKAYAGG